MIGSFLTGVTRACRQWKMIVLLLVANLIFAIPIVTPLFLLIIQTTNQTLTANKMIADKVDFDWLVDMLNRHIPGVSLDSLGYQIGGLAAVMGLGYLLLSAFLAGGIIETFAAEARGLGRFTMRRFWAGCGAYFGRFIRLTLISLLFYGTAYLIYWLISRPVSSAQAQATAYESVVYKRWTVLVVLLLLFGFVNMVFDYARISVVLNDSRKMFRAAIGAFRFSLRHFFRTFGLYLLIAVCGLGLFFLLGWLRWSVNQATAMGILWAIILGQIAMAVRMWTRMTFYAAQLDLYWRLNPLPVAPPQPIAPPPPIEFMAAEEPGEAILPANHGELKEEGTDETNEK